MGNRDLVEDITRAARIGKRVLTGEMTIADVLLDRNPPAPAPEGEPRCDKSPGCIARPNHEGGCIFDAKPDEVPRE